MKNENIIEKYCEYRDKIGDRTEIYKTVAEHYGVKSVRD